MKGLDMLAKACEPAAPENPATPAAAALTDEQCNQIAQKVISMLQSGLPEEKDPDPDPKPEAPEEPDLPGGEEE